MPDAGRRAPPAPRWQRWLWLLAAWLALALGALGLVVPGLPTTPFVLLAAAAAFRGSERLHGWLLGHGTFGAILRDWETNRGIRRGAKWAATGTMAACAGLMALVSDGPWYPLLGTAVMAVVAVWIWRRPEPPAATGR